MKKKLKSRPTKALLESFKDEMLKAIGRLEKPTEMQPKIVANEFSIVELKSEMELDDMSELTDTERAESFPIVYENALDMAKRDLYYKLIYNSKQFIQVDESSLMGGDYEKRKIRISLFVGTRNK